MGTKRRIKRSNQEKQGNHQDDDSRNTATARNFDVADLINSLHDDILSQIIPVLLRTRNQQKERDPDNITGETADVDPNDFISRLPNSILYNIISLLPFESAVRTTFLSTQWKDLWKDVLLDSVCAETMEDAVVTILSFLDDIAKQHQPRKNWGFRFMFGDGRVLLAAFAPNKNSLRLDFSAGKQELPNQFDCLLKLMNSESYSHRRSWYSFNQTWDDPFYTHQSSFNKMKVMSLHLISVSHSSNEAISSMVSSFPFLESLTIAKCSGLRSLKVKSTRGLSRLVVLDCPQLVSLCYDGCSLTSFQYRGRLVSFEFEELFVNPIFSYPVNRRNFLLKDAMLDFRQGPPLCHSFNSDGFKSSILESIKSVKSLTLCRWLFEALISWMLPSLKSGSDSEFRFYALKELWWIDCSMQKDNINVLLNLLKFCPYLERLYVTIDPKSYSMTRKKRFSDRVNQLGKFYHLKLLRLEGFANENQEIFFAKQLRPLFKTRPLIVAKRKGACLRSLVKVPELEKEGKYPYKFKEVKNLHEKCPDHIHMKL